MWCVFAWVLTLLRAGKNLAWRIAVPWLIDFYECSNVILRTLHNVFLMPVEICMCIGKEWRKKTKDPILSFTTDGRFPSKKPRPFKMAWCTTFVLQREVLNREYRIDCDTEGAEYDKDTWFLCRREGWTKITRLYRMRSKPNVFFSANLPAPQLPNQAQVGLQCSNAKFT